MALPPLTRLDQTRSPVQDWAFSVKILGRKEGAEEREREGGKKQQVALPDSVPVQSPIYSAWWPWCWTHLEKPRQGPQCLSDSRSVTCTVIEQVSRNTQREPRDTE